MNHYNQIDYAHLPMEYYHQHIPMEQYDKRILGRPFGWGKSFGFGLPRFGFGNPFFI
ncbi:hypothetical protein ACFFF5_15745 [Lederbergia wuyishanensis]|uniref:Uncharacterized protein n=1 Tax=Lederbergia wuyishanensis TaxID=1347903 RepID=A0ABU0D8P1_9BACI|nr:hypothetical protein [Lederbergia wuyishanensis]MCJ8007623.1 hypothetical protein [Lederbergia wuyishanensis]MDQ0344792.1 hypothetical protein [Lederbergia wuyishanensis]